MDRLKEHYDWAVIGEHPAALWTGLVMAKSGHSVVFVPYLPLLNWAESERGQGLDPNPNYVLGAHALMGSMLPDAEQIFRKTVAQVLTPEARIRWGAQTEEALRLVGREFSASDSLIEELSKALQVGARFTSRYFSSFDRAIQERTARSEAEDRRFLQNHHAQKLFEQAFKKERARSERSVRSVLDRLLGRAVEGIPLSQRHWAEVFEGLGAALGGEDPIENAPEWTLGRLSTLIGLSSEGRSIRGGIGRLSQLLKREAEAHGAMVLPFMEEFPRFFVEEGRLVGFQIKGLGRMTSVGHAVLGGSLEHFRSMVIHTAEGMQALKKAPAPTHWRFTLALSVHREALPPGVTHRMLWKERGAPALEIETARGVEYGGTDEDERLVFLRTWLPYTQESLSSSHQRKLAARMFEQYKRIIPFSEYHVSRIYPDFRVEDDQSGEDEFSQVYGFVAPNLIPDNLKCYGGIGVGMSSGLSHLFVASHESYPRFGSFGPFVAALEALSMLAPQALGKDLSGARREEA